MTFHLAVRRTSRHSRIWRLHPSCIPHSAAASGTLPNPNDTFEKNCNTRFLPQDASASSASGTHALCAAAACNLALLSSHCNQAVASALPSIIAAVDNADLLVRRTALLALTSAAHSHTSWLTPQLTCALMEVLLRHVKLDESLMRQVITASRHLHRLATAFMPPPPSV